MRSISVIFYISLLLTLVAEADLEKVSVQFRWLHQFQFAGFYAAEEKGYYRDAGLKVELKEMSPSMKEGEINEVLSGNANYGVTFSNVVSARLQGQPVVVLAAIFQHSATAIFARADSGVSNLHDILSANATFGNFTENPEFIGMFFNEGIPFEKVLETLPIQDAIVTREAIYEFDVIPGYLTDQPFFLQKHNIPYLVFKPSTYGYDFYGDCIYTSEKELSDHPERTARFLQASLEGWKYAMHNIEEMVDLILEKYEVQKRGVTRESLLFEAEAMKKLILPDMVEMGHMGSVLSRNGG